MSAFKVKESVRLDKFLMNSLELSRSKSLSLLEHGFIKVNRQTVNLKAKGRILKLGDRVELFEVNLSDLEIIKPNNLNLKLLHEEAGFVVVDKPADMPVMPLYHLESNTVLNDLVYRFPEIQGVGEAGLRSGVVHRLDNNTSGVLVVARQDEAWHKLRTAFKTHKTSKIYHVLVQGYLKGEGSLKEHLTVTQHSPAKVSVVDAEHKGARLCDLSWRSLEAYKELSLLEIELGSGFLHQIRVMMAHIGHPVLGDGIYNQNTSVIANCSRQMLHASSISVLGITTNSDLATDFKACLDHLS